MSAHQLVQSLARGFDGAGSTSKTNLRKILIDHVGRLAPLRSTASEADLETFFTIAAWYLTKPYILKQDCILQRDYASEDLRIIEESRRIKAISTLHQTWGAKALDTIRRDLYDPLPLPTVPARDFLETLSKIAARVTLKQFLQHFPDFVRSRIESWRQDRQYWTQEEQPCLQSRHVDAFFKDWYTPNVLEHGAVEPLVKRRKTNPNQGRTRSPARTRNIPRDGEIEIARGASQILLVVEDDTVVQESSPIRPITSSHPRGEEHETDRNWPAESQNQINRSNTSFTEDSELQIDAGSALFDEDSIQGIPIDDDSTIQNSGLRVSVSPGVNTMPRPRGPSQEQVRSTRLVQSKYNELQQHEDDQDVMPAMRWGIKTASKLEAIKANKAAATAALAAADNELHKLEELLLTLLPHGKDLDEAISDQENEIKHTQLHIEKLLRLQALAKEAALGVAMYGLHESTNVDSFAFNETKAGAVKISKECELNRLKSFKEQYHEKFEDRKEKSDEVDRTDDEYLSAVTVIAQLREFLDLIPGNSAAVAKLPLPSLKPGGDD